MIGQQQQIGTSPSFASHGVTRIGADNRAHHTAELDAMHRDRKTVFIDQLKWDLPVTDTLYEIDEYDRDDTLYLLVPDPHSPGHLGSVRLLASTTPHLLADKFASLCAEGVPRGPQIFEITRMVIRPGLSRAEGLRVRQHLSIAILEYALENGISRYTMMTHMAFLSSVIAVGWDCEPLGLPETHDGVAIAALSITVDRASLTRLRQQYDIPAPVLRGSESALAA